MSWYELSRHDLKCSHTQSGKRTRAMNRSALPQGLELSPPASSSSLNCDLYFLIVMGGPLGFAATGALVTLSLAPPILFHVPVPSLPVATTTPGDCTL
jgi:hypothetical protein